MGDGPWRIWVDTGGTFTDCIALSPAGEARRAKVLSSGEVRVRVVGSRGRTDRIAIERPAAMAGLDLAGSEVVGDGGGVARVSADDGSEISLDRAIEIGAAVTLRTGETAPVLAARIVTATPAGRPLPRAELRLATTRGTNALLERTLTPTVLFVTRGFGDLLEIGDQRRPDLFALDIRKPVSLVARVVEVDERLDAAGAVVRELDEKAVADAARACVAAGLTTAAVAFAHAWRNPAHEERVLELLREAGFTHVSVSSRLSGRIKLLARATTAVVNAALSGPVEGFVAATAQPFGGGGRVRVMTSAAGLVDAAAFAPKDSLLSGPAAGLLGALASASRASGGGDSAGNADDGAIGFDMGGTSTDVAWLAGEVELTASHRVGGVEIQSPAVAIESIAAGGGSICGFDVAGGEATPFVGPRSAGADPGPACYGRGGPLTLTDVNVLLGRIDPATFGVPLDVEASRRALERVLDEAAGSAAQRTRPDSQQTLELFVRLANERMADAIRRISTRLGRDVSRATLVAFGGAGPQHACAIAELLGVSRIVVPRDSSLLSAAGIGLARPQRIAERSVLKSLDGSRAELDAVVADLELAAAAELEAQGEHHDQVEIVARRTSLRFVGQEATVEVAYGTPEAMAAAFRARADELYGTMPDRAIEVESVRVIAEAGRSMEAPAVEGAIEAASGDRRGRADESKQGITARAWFGGAWTACPSWRRESLPQDGAAGPALIAEERTVTVVERGWTARNADGGDLVLERSAEVAGGAAASREAAAGAASEAVRIEIAANRLDAAAAEMGDLLKRAAISTNVKERLDYSCAILDAAGELVVSAPHIPVHLGALGLCVRRVLDRLAPGPGDVIVVNHPAFGGSHLPDVTVIAAAFEDRGTRLGFTACRAHHAEIGGTRPGSMPPDATRLVEEGVVIPPMLVVEGGASRVGRVRELLTSAKFPTRAISDNIADLEAQIAAVRLGVRAIEGAQRGIGDVAAACSLMQERSRSRLAEAMRVLGVFDRRGEVVMDDGAALRVRIVSDGSRLSIDFTGSAGEHARNLNAPLAVTQSAVMYVLRVLIGRVTDAAEIPLNDGLMRPVDLVVPRGMLNPVFGEDAAACPAVAGGNVETSQQVVNLLLMTLGLSAASQGTMNNFLFGDAKRGYYETIGGGAGAGDGFSGASGVHTHMTNTAITDCEVLEHRYPVRLERFAIRRESGGAGKWRGGDGLVRRVRFLAPMSVSLVTSQRLSGPRGVEGGADGAAGVQRVVRADGGVEVLAAAAGVEVGVGDVVEIETPGGGGWGAVDGIDLGRERPEVTA